MSRSTVILIYNTSEQFWAYIQKL